MYRQGDVLVIAVAELPEQLTPIAAGSDPRRLVLAEGEATGHAHSLAWPSIATAGSDGASLYFTAGKGAAVVHQEHDPITLPAGHYRVVRQREYSPEAIRNVAD